MNDKLNDKTEMTLNSGDWFTLKEEDPRSNFKGVNLFLKNTGKNVVKVSTDGSSILITVEMNDKK